MQQVHQSARGHRQSGGGPQQLGELRQRHAHLDVHLHRQGGDAGAQLHAGGAECVGSLQPMPALHAPSTVRAMSDFDVEAPHQRTHRGQFFLILRRHAGHIDRAAAVRARARDRHRVGFVDQVRAHAPTLPAIGCTSLAARPPATSLRSVLGEGSCLPATRTARRIELLLEPFAAVLPALPVLPQPGDLPLQFLNAAGILLAPRRILIAALPRPSHTCVSASIHRTYSPAAHFMAATPVNEYLEFIPRPPASARRPPCCPDRVLTGELEDKAAPLPRTPSHPRPPWKASTPSWTPLVGRALTPTPSPAW